MTLEEVRTQLGAYLTKPLDVTSGSLSTQQTSGIQVVVPVSNAILGDLNNVVRANNGDLVAVPPDWLSLSAPSFVRTGANTFTVNNPGSFNYFAIGDKLKITYASSGTLYYYIVGKKVATKTIKVVRSKPIVTDIDIPTDTIKEIYYTKATSTPDFPALMDHVPTVTSTGDALTVNGLAEQDSYNKFFIVGNTCFFSVRTYVDITINSGVGVPVKMTLPFDLPPDFGQIFSPITIIPSKTGDLEGVVSIGGFTDAVTLFSWQGLQSTLTGFIGQFFFPIRFDQ